MAKENLQQRSGRMEQSLEGLQRPQPLHLCLLIKPVYNADTMHQKQRQLKFPLTQKQPSIIIIKEYLSSDGDIIHL